MADATTNSPCLDFYLKMAFVFAGLFVLIRMRRQIFEDPQLDRAPVTGNAKMLAWASLGVLVWRDYGGAVGGLCQITGQRWRSSPTFP